ncbi:unnamed protein product [Prunus brigantina]
MGVGGGAMVLGGMKSPHDMFGFCNCPYYNIELKGIYVAAYPLKLNPKVFDGGYGTVLDSGTFPRMLFLRLRILSHHTNVSGAYCVGIFESEDSTTTLEHLHPKGQGQGKICSWACPSWWIPCLAQAGFCSLEVEIGPEGALCQPLRCTCS